MVIKGIANIKADEPILQFCPLYNWKVMEREIFEMRFRTVPAVRLGTLKTQICCAICENAVVGDVRCSVPQFGILQHPVFHSV
jgi:hypothetical protein